MKSVHSKFYRDFIIVLLICIAGAILIARFALQTTVPVSFWISLAFIGAITVFIHKILVGANSKRPQTFVTYFMGALTGKLLLSAMILLVVGVLDPGHLKFTGIGFFIAYVLLTVIEFVHLLPLVRNSGR